MTEADALFDHSRENAESAVEALEELVREGIPQRMKRLRHEAFRILEALWLINFHAHEGLINDKADGAEGRFGLVLLSSWASAAEAQIHVLMETMRPLADNRVGPQLDGYLDKIWEIRGEDGCLEEFIEIYKDSDREEQVSRLNALLKDQQEEN